MFTIYAFTEALSPITHMSGVSGNAALLKREKIIGTDGCVERVPCISGNALRHALVRAPGAEYLYKALGLSDISYQMADFLWHGGKLTKATPLSCAKTKDFLKAIPLIALLGGALPGQILDGALRVSRAILICRETSGIISDTVGFDIKASRGAESYISPYLYTRACAPNDPDAIEDRMIYEGETVIAGSRFFHKFSVDSDDPTVIGALIHSIVHSRRCVGGMGRIGHGELAFTWCAKGLSQKDMEDLKEKYTSHVKENAAPARDILFDIFGASCEKRRVSPEKPQKKGAKSRSSNAAASSTDHDAFADLF